MSFQEYSESIKSKLKIGNLNRKLIIGLVVFAIASIAFSAYTVFMAGNAYPSNNDEIEIVDADESTDDKSDTNYESDLSSKVIYVHVAGCVKSTGVYCVPEGSRVDDAIKLAGGFTKSADQSAVNLAETVSDGQQIIVPEKGKSNSNANTTSLSSLQQDSRGINSVTSNDLVNINDATSEQLQTLTGIGEAKAKKIIDYREQSGPFNSVEELINVSGIGEKTLESIRSYICV